MLKEIDLTICRFEELRWYKKKANHLKQQALALPTLQLFFTMQFTSTTDYNVFADFKSIEREKETRVLIDDEIQMTDWCPWILL